MLWWRHLDPGYVKAENGALCSVVPRSAPFSGTDVVKNPKSFVKSLVSELQLERHQISVWLFASMYLSKLCCFIALMWCILEHQMPFPCLQRLDLVSTVFALLWLFIALAFSSWVQTYEQLKKLPQTAWFLSLH